MRRRRTKEEERIRSKKRYLLHPEKANAANRRSYARNRMMVLARRREKFLSLSEEEKIRLKEKASLRSKEWGLSNPEKVKATQHRYFRANQKKRSQATLASRRRTKYVKRREESDANFLIKRRLACRILAAVRRINAKKCANTVELIGCTVQELRDHLERLFQPGMTWQNFGEWHIDHKIPCAEFDLRSEFQQLQCFHFSNLQPLWGKDNLSKGSKLTEPYQKTLPL